MARWCAMLLLALAVVQVVTARTVPGDAGLNDQKNVVTFGGIGGYSGVGSNGLPIGGIGGAVGVAGGGLGGTPSGISGVGGGVGLGPGGLTGGFAPFGGYTNIGGANGGGSGNVPLP